MADTPRGDTAAVQATPTARDLQQTQEPPPALIRPYDAKRDQKLTRYLIGAGVMEPQVYSLLCSMSFISLTSESSLVSQICSR